jgi:hypothetical protein
VVFLGPAVRTGKSLAAGLFNVRVCIGMTALDRNYKQHLGLYWLAFVAAVSFILLVFRPAGLHYLTFTGAARAFWAGAPMYNVEFEPGTPKFFYSPACAAFFYSWFSYLPNQWGRNLYMIFSLFTLAGAIRYLRGTYRSVHGNDFDVGWAGQLLWVMLSSEINGAIFADKLEILILAMFFFAMGLSWRGQYGWAAALLAVVANWKFQSLPLLGLLVLVWVRHGQVFRPVLMALAVFATLGLAPYLFQNAAYLNSEQAVWKTSLSAFMEQAWMAPIFHHVYGFLAKTLGIHIPYAWSTWVSAAWGGLFALVVLRQLFLHKDSSFYPIVFAFGLGAAFTVLFSPLSQGTGYILYLPLPILLLIQFRSYRLNERLLLGLLVVGYFFVSLCVSDLTPKPLRSWFYDHGFKALGALVMTFAVLGAEVTTAWRSGKTKRF